MDYLILTQTDFFGMIDGNDNQQELNAAYNGFVQSVIGLCCGRTDMTAATIAMTYAENELQHHAQYSLTGESHTTVYVRKALAFVRKMQRHFLSNRSMQLPQLSPISASSEMSKEENSTVPILRWTGKASDLVELLYGIDEMNCINNGETPLKDIAAFFYKSLGVDAKECYRIYADMKLRKSDRRTYFIDKMSEKVNRRMEMDEERERMRR